MQTRFISTFSLLALLLVSCAPVAATEAPGAGQPSVQQPAPPVVVEPSATPAAESPAAEASSTEAAAPTPIPVATSRGPDLHATDPGTVNLSSGQLTFVEFFRFT